MVNGNASTAAPKKRGRPPGTKKAKSAQGKSASKGIRYNVDRQREIVAFIRAQGRGGLSKAKAKFGVSFPTLARWVKQGARPGKGGSKTRAGTSKKGHSRKSGPVPSGHVLISKKVLKDFHKGIANLEAALGSFANALRVLE